MVETLGLDTIVRYVYALHIGTLPKVPRCARHVIHLQPNRTDWGTVATSHDILMTDANTFNGEYEYTMWHNQQLVTNKRLGCAGVAMPMGAE